MSNINSKNKGGRPLKFKDPIKLEAKIQEYFQWAKDNKKHITITGLAWYLDTNRQTLLNYSNPDSELYKWIDDDTIKQELIDSIKRAKARIEMEYEETLYNKNSSVGGIFTLKNNFGWVDKQEIVQENKEIKVTLDD